MKNLSIILSLVLHILTLNNSLAQNLSVKENPNWNSIFDWTVIAPTFEMTASSKLIHNSNIGDNDLILGKRDTLTIAKNVTFTTSGTIHIKNGGVLIVNGSVEGMSASAQLIIDGALLVRSSGSINWRGDFDKHDTSGDVIIDGEVWIAGNVTNNGVITGGGCMQLDGILSNGGNLFGCPQNGDGCGNWLGVCSGALPIELLDFNIVYNGSSVELNWSTASEYNNDYFTIERSINQLDWEKILIVDGSGNSTNNRSYKVNDHQYLEGVSYYRLLQTDFNGVQEYMAIDAIKIEDNIKLKVYPNPSENIVNVRGKFTNTSNMILYNSFQQVVNLKIQLTDNQALFNVSDLGKGVYFLHVISKNKVDVVSLVVR